MKNPTRIASLAALVALGLPAASFAQTLLLEYTFDDTGTTSASTGTNTTSLTFRDSTGASADLHGASGSGLTSLAGDRAFDNTASNSMGNKAGASAAGGSGLIGDVDTGSAGSDWLTSFTVQGWFKVDSVIGGAARILDKTTGATTSFTVRAGLVDGQLAVTVDNQTVNSATSFTATNQWVFFAVTYDGGVTTNNVKFYTGTAETGVSLVGSALTLNAGPVSNNTLAMVLGNTANNPNPTVYNRPFDGLLDNIRLYGAPTDATGALSLAQLEAIRVADVSPIPEPSAFAALAGALGLGCAATRRRRRS